MESDLKNMALAYLGVFLISTAMWTGNMRFIFYLVMPFFSLYLSFGLYVVIIKLKEKYIN